MKKVSALSFHFLHDADMGGISRLLEHPEERSSVRLVEDRESSAAVIAAALLVIVIDRRAQANIGLREAEWARLATVLAVFLLPAHRADRRNELFHKVLSFSLANWLGVLQSNHVRHRLSAPNNLFVPMLRRREQVTKALAHSLKYLPSLHRLLRVMRRLDLHLDRRLLRLRLLCSQHCLFGLLMYHHLCHFLISHN